MNLRKLNKIESEFNSSKGLKKAKAKPNKPKPTAVIKAAVLDAKKNKELLKKIPVETTAIPSTEKVVEKTTNA